MRRGVFPTFSGLAVLSVCLLFGVAQETPGSRRGTEPGGDRQPGAVTGPPGASTDPAPDGHHKDEFIRQLFVKYGDGQGRLSFDGFAQLLDSIGLGLGAGAHIHRETGRPSAAPLSSRPPHRHADPAPHDDDGEHHRQHQHHDTQTPHDHDDHHDHDHASDGQATSTDSHEAEDPFSSTTDRNEHTVGLSAPGSDGGSVTAVDKHPDEPGTGQSKDEHLNQCLTSSSLLGIFEIPASASGLSEEQFMHLCPVLLQQLDSHVCMRFDMPGNHHDNGGHHDDDHDDGHDDHDHHDGAGTHHRGDELSTVGHAGLNVTGVYVDRLMGPIWGYGVAAITLISLASIACILVVPCMQHYPDVYHRLISFLVAMAVGTLAGDAMMHLIPHSLGIHVHDDKSGGEAGGPESAHAHEDAVSERERAINAVWKGFFVLIGIFAFFVIEQLMAVCQQARRKRKARRKAALRDRADQKNSSQRPLHRPDSRGDGGGDRGAAGAIVRDDDEDDGRASGDDTVPAECSKMAASAIIGEKLCHHCVAASSTHVGPSRDLIRNSMFLMDDLTVPAATPNCNNHHSRPDDPETAGPQGHSHGHGHGHGHSHEPPPIGAGGIATLAWIVVMGDGLHNFCDGLVVGAAYADSIAGGLSTSIAVMCHELPHELGDFAVMLKAGMSVKQALMVQLVSSVLAFLGLAIGIAAGNVEALSTWIFALAGGMFVYIALVDLFPELIETLNSQPGQKLKFLVLESLGTLTGVSIMLFIGLHEDWLREQLDS